MIFAAFGLHVWTRLVSLCPIRQQAGTAFGIWMAVNILWAFLVFVSFAVGFSTSPVGLLGFIAAPGSLLVAHVWTEIPLRWLRGCGWEMVRIGETEPKRKSATDSS
jgi:Na+/proline symporter